MELDGNVAGTTYTHASPDDDDNSYWVTACNSAGCSAIDSANPAQFVDNRPAAPANAQYRHEGSTTVVSWDPSAGATHYKVYYDDFFGTSCRIGSGGSPSFCELLAGNVPGTTYTHTSPDADRNYYWVVGCNSTGCSDIDSRNPATLVGTTRSVVAPGAPTSLTATANGQTQIDLSWSAPTVNGGANITGYRIEVSTNGSSWTDLVANTGNTTRTYSHTGLTAGSTRHYRVLAINSAGTGTASNTANATTGAASAAVPGAPRVLTATANGQTRIDLSWSAPTTNGGAVITGYRIEVSTNGSSWSDLVANTGSATTTYSHTGLTAGSTRHYRVSAISSAGTGTASNVATGTTAAAGVPAAPIVTGVTAGTGGLTVSWSAPPGDGGSRITAYDLRHIRSDATNKGDANWTVIQDVWTGSGARNYELAGLDGGAQYDVQVRAVNSAGEGSWSATVTGTTASTETTPSSPVNAQHYRDGSMILVTWDPSAEATYYKVYHSDSRFPRCSLSSFGTALGCVELDGNVAGTTYTHSSPDDDYNSYWVTACNSAGCSAIDSANPAQFVDNRPAAPANAQYRHEGSTTVVSWDPSAGATHYKVYYDDFFGTSCRIGSGGSPSFCELLAGNVPGTTYTHTSPDADRNYYWVVGCNSTGCSDIDSRNPATLVVTTRSVTAPGAPTGLTATANGQTQIDLSWSAPTINGGANITGYRIEVSTNGSSWSDLETNTGFATTTYSHTGLAAGSMRHYRVSAINSAGTGTASNTANATTGAASAAVPGAPRVLTATANGQTRIDLSWSAPTTNGGANITGYRIEVSTNGSSWSDLVANTGSATTTYSHTGLTAGSTRHYRVSAISSAGTGRGVQHRQRGHHRPDRRCAVGHQRLRIRRRRGRCCQQPGAGVRLRSAAGR